jgi:hypothetical protein
MAKRSSINYLDRLYSTLLYLFPMAAVVSIKIYGQILMLFGFADFLVAQFSPLGYALLPFSFVDKILSIRIIDFISIRFVSWFCIFIFVVRSYKINHFTRFNAMQALMLDIVVTLVEVIVNILWETIGRFDFFPFILQTISSVTFLTIISAFVYSVFNCVQGKYSDKIPLISDVAYYQIR